MAPVFHVEALLPSSISPKIDSILHSHVFRAVSRFKALLVDVVLGGKKRTPPRASGGGHAAAAGYGYGYHRSRSATTARSGKKSKIASFVTKLQFVGSSSSAPRARVQLDVDRAPYSYYDSAWSVAVPAEQEVVHGACGGGGDTAECGYLCWLEEERSGDAAAPAGEEGGGEDGGDGDSIAVNEIDRLAEKFIARFHAKFLLEKQESYRRYQEMMARSV